MNRTVLIALVPLGLFIVGVAPATTSSLGWVSKTFGLLLLVIAVAGLMAQNARALK